MIRTCSWATLACLSLTLLLSGGLTACDSGSRSNAAAVTSGGGGGGGGGGSGGGGTTGLLSYGTTNLSTVQAGSTVPGTVLASIFTLQAQTAAPVTVSAMTWTASGTVNETIFSRGLVVEDVNNNSILDTAELNSSLGESNPAFSANNGTMTITFTTALTIPASSTRQFFLLFDGSGIAPVTTALAGQTSAIAVAAATDITATSGGSATTAGGTFGTAQTVSLGIHDHLLISEVAFDPTASEFIEIFNPTPYTVTMTNYHISDVSHRGGTAGTTNFPYWELVNGGFTPATAFTPLSTSNSSDWHARFPSGFTILSGETIILAMDGASFAGATFANPVPANTKVLALRNVVAPGQTAMRVFQGTSSFDFIDANAQGATPVTCSNAGLTNGGEGVILYFWDGQANPVSPLVTDIDYVFWGTEVNSNTRILKTTATSVTLGGNTQAFMNDGAGSNVTTAATNDSVVRNNFVESGEGTSGGNGFNGDDEIGEPGTNWTGVDTPTPGRIQ